MTRAQLNGGTGPLTFQLWDGHGFSSPALGGTPAPILPSGPYQNCGAASQERHMASIYYVDSTQQYLLMFNCDSPTDPASGQGSGKANGAAWFYSTSSDLSDPTQWTAPKEITGSWSEYDTSGSCPSYKGDYASFMSLGSKPGHLTTNGYAFFLWGCAGAGTPGGHQYASRDFTISGGRRGGRIRPALECWCIRPLRRPGVFLCPSEKRVRPRPRRNRR